MLGFAVRLWGAWAGSSGPSLSSRCAAGGLWALFGRLFGSVTLQHEHLKLGKAGALHDARRMVTTDEVNAFLTHLAVDLPESGSSQNQALSALLFLDLRLLERDLDVEGVIRARARRRLPVVLSEAQVRAVRRKLKGDPALVVGLL